MSGKFILLKGSLLATEVFKSFKSTTSRDLFIKEHCKKDKGQIFLLHDFPFDSPSGASGFVLGRPSNGWDDWKDADGKKLSEIIKNFLPYGTYIAVGDIQKVGRAHLLRCVTPHHQLWKKFI